MKQYPCHHDPLTVWNAYDWLISWVRPATRCMALCCSKVEAMQLLLRPLNGVAKRFDHHSTMNGGN